MGGCVGVGVWVCVCMLSKPLKIGCHLLSDVFATFVYY